MGKELAGGQKGLWDLPGPPEEACRGEVDRGVHNKASTSQHQSVHHPLHWQGGDPHRKCILCRVCIL